MPSLKADEVKERFVSIENREKADSGGTYDSAPHQLYI